VDDTYVSIEEALVVLVLPYHYDVAIKRRKEENKNKNT
jgi:hypothetical protein